MKEATDVSTDPRKRISEAFLSDAPGGSDCVDRRLLEGHYYKSLLASKNTEEHNLTQDDREFIKEALEGYVDFLIGKNFWSLAHLSKKRSLHEIDPFLANEVYRICLNVDELKAILYFDSANEG